MGEGKKYVNAEKIFSRANVASFKFVENKYSSWASIYNREFGAVRFIQWMKGWKQIFSDDNSLLYIYIYITNIEYVLLIKKKKKKKDSYQLFCINT